MILVMVMLSDVKDSVLFKVAFLQSHGLESAAHPHVTEARRNPGSKRNINQGLQGAEGCGGPHDSPLVLVKQRLVLRATAPGSPSIDGWPGPQDGSLLPLAHGQGPGRCPEDTSHYSVFCLKP